MLLMMWNQSDGRCRMTDVRKATDPRGESPVSVAPIHSLPRLDVNLGGALAGGALLQLVLVLKVEWSCGLLHQQLQFPFLICKFLLLCAFAGGANVHFSPSQ